MRLKKLYSSREVAAMTGLSARQLQWWHARRLFVPSVAPQKTDAGGYTERRYTPVELLELWCWPTSAGAGSLWRPSGA